MEQRVFEVTVKCTACDGQGDRECGCFKPWKCDMCNGTGRERCGPCQGSAKCREARTFKATACEHCATSGSMRCWYCGEVLCSNCLVTEFVDHPTHTGDLKYHRVCWETDREHQRRQAERDDA